MELILLLNPFLICRSVSMPNRKPIEAERSLMKL